MQLPCLSLVHFPVGLLCETGSISHCGNLSHSPQTPLSPLKLAPLVQLWGSQLHSLGCHVATVFLSWPMQSTALPAWLFWLIFFFNSLVVRVPCSLIFWCFWLFIDFRLVGVLLLVVQGSEGFLPTPPS